MKTSVLSIFTLFFLILFVFLGSCARRTPQPPLPTERAKPRIDKDRPEDPVLAPKQWNIPAGAKARIGKGRINAIAFSPDSEQLAVGSGIGVWVYNVSDAAPLALFGKDRGGAETVAYSPDNKILASAGAEISLYDTQTQTYTQTIRTGGQSIAYSPDGETLAIANWKDILFLNPQTGEMKKMLSGHSGRLTRIAYSPDGKTLASASQDLTVRLWRVDTGDPIHTFSGYKETVWDIAFSPDSRTLASTGIDGVRLWDVQTGTLKRHISVPVRYALSYFPDGKSIAVEVYDAIDILDAETGALKQKLPVKIGMINALKVSPDGKTLAVASYEGEIFLYDIATKTHRRTIAGHFPRGGVALSPDGKTLATGSFNRLRLYNVANGDHKHTYPQGIGYDVVYAPDGSTLTTAFGQELCWINVETGERTQTLKWDSLPSALAYSRDGQILAVGVEQTIELWDVPTAKMLRSLSGHASTIRKLAFSPDGERLASISWDKSVWLWDTRPGGVKKILWEHSEEILSLAYAPDGKIVAASSWDEIRLYHTDTGKQMFSLRNADERRIGDSLAFSADGKTLASSGHLWDARTGDHKHRLHGHKLPVFYLAFTPDGSTLISASHDGTILLWDMKQNF